MSPIAAGLDGMLALLMIAALILGARLNARLKTLRDGQAGFAAAVIELNQAAAWAEAGLNALKAAQEGAHEDLLNRIEVARNLVAKLERAGVDAERRVAARPAVAAESSSNKPGAALAAIAALAEGRLPARANTEAPSEVHATADASGDLRANPPPRGRPARGAFDEDLFEAQAPRRDDPFGLAALNRGAVEPAAPTPRPAVEREPVHGPLDLGPLDVAPRAAEPPRARPDPLKQWKAVR